MMQRLMMSQRRMAQGSGLGLLAGCLWLCSAAASAAPLAAVPASFVPHEAVYQLALAQNRPSSHVTSATGTMVFLLRDTCDGWTTDQTLDIQILSAEGDSTQLRVQNSSWEAKDGQTYHFTSRTVSNTDEPEIFRGQARLSASGGEAVYTLPRSKRVALRAGTLFPNHYTALVLSDGLAGRSVPSQRVFDGTDENAESDVTVFVGKPSAASSDANLAADLQKHPLLQQPAWPIQLAFFSAATPTKTSSSTAGTDAIEDRDTASGLPDYELGMDMTAGGVARRMLMDYGSFSVRGTLQKLRALPMSFCR
jgi:hypothetical protein